MGDTLQKIQAVLLENFPEIGDMEITGEMKLGDIPGFDSMVAVNLQMFLDELFHVVIVLDLLNEETTLGELVTFIEHPEQMIEAGKKER